MDQDLEEILSRFPISQPGLLAIETNEYLCSGILWDSWRQLLRTKRNEGRIFVDELVEKSPWISNLDSQYLTEDGFVTLNGIHTVIATPW